MSPLYPRNLEQQGPTGQAKDDERRGTTMAVIRSVRWLLLALLLLAVPAASFAQIGVSISVGPPVLPVYAQPICPGPGYMWTPGYWAYGDSDYYWVPGTWVVAPAVGLLWTPGYWGWSNGFYLWNAGYWGPHIGFYGGINYGYGYGGVGYEGGYWNRGQFYYNRSVTNVNVTNVTNVYNRTVINNTTVNNVSYNGGTGGARARPTPAEQVAARERHVQPTKMQTQQVQAARNNRALYASVNHGQPAIAATSKPGVFTGNGVVAAKQAGAPYHPAATASRQIPRPPSAGGNAMTARPNTSTPARNIAAPSVANNHGTRPGNNVPRPSTAQGSASAPHAAAPQAQSVPRPQSTPHPQGAGYPQSSPHAQNAPRPQSVPRSQTASRPENMPRAQSESHSQSAPHHENAPHQQSAPHPASGGEERHH